MHPLPPRDTAVGRLRLALYFLLAMELALAALYVIGLNTGEPGIRPLFDLDQEGNLPTWFSSAQLLVIACLLGFYAVRPLQALGVPVWLTLAGAAVFLFLSMDETAQVHENVARDLRSIEWLPRVRNDRGIWVFVYVAAAVPPLLLVLRHLPTLWRKRRLSVYLFAAGVAATILGGMGIELIADQFLRGGAAPHRSWYYTSVLLEETLEMFGATLILLGVARLAFHDALAADRYSRPVAHALGRLPASSRVQPSARPLAR